MNHAGAAALRIVFLSWERHRRTREIANALSATLVEVSSGWKRPWKYGPLALGSIRRLAALRPEALIVQCPSVILAVLAVCLRPWLRHGLVLDLHNEAVEPFNHPGPVSNAVLRWLWRRAAVCVVTNEALARRLEGQAKAVVLLPDRVPTFEAGVPIASSAELCVVFICTYAADEPYAEVLDAARLLPPSVRVYVTGNPARAQLPADLPANVTICGFLPLKDYEHLLQRADVLVDLTSMENCLVCGAYEAVGLEKPLVTSDTAALRAYFSQGTVFARHTPAALAEAIQTALRDRRRLAAEMRDMSPRLARGWDAAFNSLVTHLQRLAGDARIPQ